MSLANAQLRIDNRSSSKGADPPVDLCAMHEAFLILASLLIGFPLTAGFIGKLMLFYAAYKAGFVALLVIAVINTMVSVYYYLRVIQAMYLVADEEKEAEGAELPPTLGGAYALVGGISVLIVLFLGIVPRWLLTLLNFYRFGG